MVYNGSIIGPIHSVKGKNKIFSRDVMAVSENPSSISTLFYWPLTSIYDSFNLEYKMFIYQKGKEHGT
jgi:hypothetical protein